MTGGWSHSKEFIGGTPSSSLERVTAEHAHFHLLDAFTTMYLCVLLCASESCCVLVCTSVSKDNFSDCDTPAFSLSVCVTVCSVVYCDIRTFSYW